MPGTVTTATIRRRSLNHEAILSFLVPLSTHYPDIVSWYLTKVIPGSNNGTRLVLPYLRDGQIVAVGIAKHEEDEKKICTVRVSQAYFGRGLGLRIFDELLHWLETKKPVLSVNQIHFAQFERIFSHYGFTLTSTKLNYYTLGQCELFFNEIITAEHSMTLPEFSAPSETSVHLQGEIYHQFHV